jgi:hypothetical protein
LKVLKKRQSGGHYATISHAQLLKATHTMLVKFESDQGNIKMFKDAAVMLLKMMGQSGVVPGALLAKDIPAALERLKRAVATQRDATRPEEDEKNGEGPSVSTRQRAFPLIELLGRAAKEECDVIWEEERSVLR